MSHLLRIVRIDLEMQWEYAVEEGFHGHPSAALLAIEVHDGVPVFVVREPDDDSADRAWFRFTFVRATDSYTQIADDTGEYVTSFQLGEWRWFAFKRPSLSVSETARRRARDAHVVPRAPVLPKAAPANQNGTDERRSNRGAGASAPRPGPERSRARGA